MLQSKLEEATSQGSDMRRQMDAQQRELTLNQVREALSTVAGAAWQAVAK